MTPNQTLGFLAFAVVAAITPGPSNIILASTGANAGIRRGLPCLLGVTLGMGLMMFTVAFGLGSVVLDRPAILTALKWAGAALLLWLAWKIATSGRGGSKSASDLDRVPAGRRAAVGQPQVVAGLRQRGRDLPGGRLAGGSALGQSASLGTLFVLAAVPSCFVWLAFGATSSGSCARTARSAPSTSRWARRSPPRSPSSSSRVPAERRDTIERPRPVGDTRSEEETDMAERTAQAAAAAALVHPPRLGRAPRHLPVHGRPARPAAADAGPVRDAAPDDGRAPLRQGARGDPRLLRGRPQPGHARDERLGRGRAGLVAEPPGPTGGPRRP